MCESYFSVLRYLSNGDNSASREESIIINKEILDYCCHETGTNEDKIVEYLWVTNED